MKTTIAILTIPALLSVLSADAASVITINVTDGGPGVNTNSTNIGGVVARPYIENIGGNGTFSGKNTTNIAAFRDSTGTSTTVSISSSSGWNAGGYQATAPTGFETGLDTSSNEMMQNFTDTSNGTVTFSGLSTWLSGQGATSFEVYVMSDRSVNLYEGSFTIGSQKYWLSNGGAGGNGANIAGPYLLGSATTLANAQTQTNTSNYLKFSGLTGNSFTLNVARDTGGSGWINVNTIQIVAVPEPAVASLGAFALLGLLRRRRA